MVANNTRYRRSQVGQDLMLSYRVNYKTEDENTLFLFPGVISKVQVFKKALLSPILVEQAGVYSKPLVTIEAGITRTPAAVSSRFLFSEKPTLQS